MSRDLPRPPDGPVFDPAATAQTPGAHAAPSAPATPASSDPAPKDPPTPGAAEPPGDPPAVVDGAPPDAPGVPASVADTSSNAPDPAFEEARASARAAIGRAARTLGAQCAALEALHTELRMEPGLPLEVIHGRLRGGQRAGDFGQRITAYFLLEIQERRLHQLLAYPDVLAYALKEHDIHPRRTRELLRAAKALAELGAIDAALARGDIGWSKVLLLVRVATPQTEAAWLAEALALSVRDLEHKVRSARPGEAPRRRGHTRGLPEARFPVGARVDALQRRQWELAHERLARIVDREPSSQEVLAEVLGFYLRHAENDPPAGPGSERSAYQVVIHVDARGVPLGRAAGASPPPAPATDGAPNAGDVSEAADAPGGAGLPEPRLDAPETLSALLAEVQLDAGLEAIGGESERARLRWEAALCDADCMILAPEAAPPEETPPPASASGPCACGMSRCAAPEARGAHVRQRTPVDIKTPDWLRRRVLARDHYRCRCCKARGTLQVHHRKHRGKGGLTVESNLITLCARCHALAHAGLLVLEGEDAATMVVRLGPDGAAIRAFLDQQALPAWDPQAGAPVSGAGPGAGPGAPGAPGAGDAGPLSPALEDVPERVDAEWWRRHLPALGANPDRTIELRGGVALWDLVRERAADPWPGAGPPATGPGPRPPATPADGNPATNRALPVADVRHPAFAGLIGLGRVLDVLEVAARDAKQRQAPFPHTLLLGPPGTGKTTLAERVAQRVGARLERATGALLGGAADLLGLLARLEPGDVLFVDEIHALPRGVMEVLYQAMSQGFVPVVLRQGAARRAIQVQVHPFTLLATTTEAARLPGALKGRFALYESLSWYPPGDLEAVALAHARAVGLGLDLAGAQVLAAAARGTPRDVRRLVDRLRADRVAHGLALGDLGAAEARAALQRLGYDEAGLCPDEQRYLALLAGQGEPMPISLLAAAMGLDRRTTELEVDVPLRRRGLVRVTRRGRELTLAGQRHATAARRPSADG